MERKDGYFGVMLDMSRNGVMRVDEVKRYVDYLAAFGYNCLQLYTEDTYEIEGEEFFGYLRGRYTKAELKEIDAYAASKGVELIPCIQTLAHLNQIFRWKTYAQYRDANDILLVGDERTYALVEKMFQTMAECFTTRKINIGMDEAHMLGRGKYLDLHGYRVGYEIIREHLEKVLEIAKKYGFQPMMWSDMFFRLATGGQYYLAKDSAPLKESALTAVPEGISLIYWDYYHTEKQDYKRMLAAHKQFNRDVWFAGGAWTWTGFAPHNDYSLRTMVKAMDACRETGVNNIFLTVWGDNGKECSQFAILPSLFYLKQYYDGVKDKRLIKQRFKELTGEDFDRMMDLDLPNHIAGNRGTTRNPSKYMLYCDPFLGFLDTACVDGVEAQYAAYAKRFARYAKDKTPLSYLYDSAAKLCKTLSFKYMLGVQSREYYQAGDKAALEELTTKYKKAEKALQEFYVAFKFLWEKECKPFGFEIFDARLGGLMQRLKACREKIEGYVAGNTQTIEELEMPLEDFWFGTADPKTVPGYNDYKQTISGCVY